MTKRVLVIGGSGMLGHKLVHVLSADPAFEVHATVRTAVDPRFRAAGAEYHAGIEIAPGDDGLARVLASLAPAVVVNAVGAIKQKKDLGSALERTFFVNGTLPHLLPLLNPNRRAQVVHFSTDCVFVGDRGGYTEADQPDAEDVYGRSKAVGELAYGAHLTIRTSIVGFELRDQLGLLGWFLRQPARSTLSGYTRAIFSGLPTVTLSRTVRDLLGRDEPLRGQYHVASDPIAKFDLLARVAAAFDLEHTLVPSEAVVIDRSLCDDRFRALTGTARPGWTELVAELREDFASLPYSDLYPEVPRGRPAARPAGVTPAG
ncbi:MAG: sugar nucleotide-binding protein [Gemmatimonadaceae bacterium]